MDQTIPINANTRVQTESTTKKIFRNILDIKTILKESSLTNSDILISETYEQSKNKKKPDQIS
jgi:hypothetical protein